MTYLLVALVAALAGGFVVWALARSRVVELQTRLDASGDLAERFKALSTETLHASIRELREEAERSDEERRRGIEQLVRPLQETLAKVDAHGRELESARQKAYGSLTAQVETLTRQHERLRSETGNLVTALRSPAARGRWGEMQLRRVVEAAGMLAHCDFVEQKTASVDERRFRPDLVVKLPGGKNVVVDAKVPLEAYLLAVEAEDEESRTTHLAAHARQVRRHVQKLSQKGYWEQFQPSPEFVVLFIAGEAFYSAALEQDATLLEETVGERVIIATPTTLITVLRTVALLWHEEKVAESAREVSSLGREVYGRLATMGGHFAKLGQRLDGAVTAYNETIGSLERRVLPAARRFADHGAAGAAELPVLDTVDRVAQKLQAPELLEASESVAELPRARDAA
jgi:DNA recombination protein RmuC